jgi:hypothetical protein
MNEIKAWYGKNWGKTTREFQSTCRKNGQLKFLYIDETSTVCKSFVASYCKTFKKTRATERDKVRGVENAESPTASLLSFAYEDIADRFTSQNSCLHKTCSAGRFNGVDHQILRTGQEHCGDHRKFWVLRGGSTASASTVQAGGGTIEPQIHLCGRGTLLITLRKKRLQKLLATQPDATRRCLLWNTARSFPSGWSASALAHAHPYWTQTLCLPPRNPRLFEMFAYIVLHLFIPSM